MRNAPHLLAEDRPDFARVLDEALRDGSVQAALRTPGPHLNAEQLHTKAMLAAAGINAEAAAEYQHYLTLRDALGGAATTPSGGPDPGPGAGLLPVLTTLTPVLAGAGGGILLLIGYTVRTAEPAVTLGRTLVTAGWVAVVIALAALLIGGVGLLLTAHRDGSPTPAGQDPHLHADLAEARRAWLTALRERALIPYLLANLDSEPALSPQPGGRPSPPDLLSPGYSSARYSSPGFSSPGVEGVTDPQGRIPRPAEFTGPGYTSPDFTGPDEV
ncbi:hypothetical protein AB0D08_14480 [Kitasatospora sp. NPDC048540]|uniref:hypothetical protein n=1 Tax=unclassified Kitasatospora TaxID=2633591 RepID=UPI00053A54D4|nr:hypothetical protein [Kitasatospora sp. MBT63]